MIWIISRRVPSKTWLREAGRGSICASTPFARSIFCTGLGERLVCLVSVVGVENVTCLDIGRRVLRTLVLLQGGTTQPRFTVGRCKNPRHQQRRYEIGEGTYMAGRLARRCDC